MELFALNITNFKIDGGSMFGVVPKVLWQRVYPADENNLCSWALRSLVIKHEGRIVLIDNGFGAKQDKKIFDFHHLFGGDGLEEGLAQLGIRPEEVTDMVLTHLHFDHCGGGVKLDNEGKPALTFPNATYYVSRSQWEWAINPNIREADSFRPENLHPMMESGHLKLIEREGPLFPWLELRICEGHTRGQMVPIIEYNGTKILFAADIFPATAHIPLIWNMSYEIDPLKTIQEKEMLLREALQNRYLLFFQHDYMIECCTLKETPKGIRVDRTLSLKEFIAEKA
ncbi:MBL fold metallo-hydrolase [Williamwhitmania taraxaci]|uniref:Glyoxylase, beta-lactamase superfamily II n=1 Tax=Williamwhitmania taraxaci TaxID=1640674 RepID=A0A1G6QWL7_9BACT|nr:MBL fold metallo-hydrolase [Williamwhitmania taraxaci]SDC96076.1 Glyoxylase, beta-lactamase superfamily II [Williamwhitmania taraxaci]